METHSVSGRRNRFELVDLRMQLIKTTLVKMMETLESRENGFAKPKSPRRGEIGIE